MENDFEDSEHESLKKTHADYKALSTEELISIIREAGITGMGGASFPTHVKIQSALKDNIDTLIINAAECEPYLSNDNRVILENCDELIGGIDILRHIFGLKNAYIGIEANKPQAIKVLNKATHKTGIRVVVLRAKYPQGGEKQLIKAVCNRTVPSGKLPSNVGWLHFQCRYCRGNIPRGCFGSACHAQNCDGGGKRSGKALQSQRAARHAVFKHT